MLLLPGATPSEATDTPNAPSDVEVRAEVTSQGFCSGALSEGLELRLRLRIINLSETSVIVARPPGLINDAEVAVDAAAGNRGEFESKLEWTPGVGDEENRHFGRRPSPSFLVLRASESKDIDVVAGLSVSRRDATKGRPIREGTTHVLRVPLPWYFPFNRLTKPEFAKLEKRWQPWGRIVTGVGFTNWVSFIVPEIPPGQLMACLTCAKAEYCSW